MKPLIVMITLIFLFSGCSSKLEPKIVVKKELICTQQYTVDQPKADIKILNTKGNIEIAKAYKRALDEAFNFYKKQTIRNNNLCKGSDNEE